MHSLCEEHSVVSFMNTLHEHNFVSVLHPNWIMESVTGQAAHTTLLKSLFKQVSAAVHARELIAGSTPAQQRVAVGSVVMRGVLSLNDILQFSGLFELH